MRAQDQNVRQRMAAKQGQQNGDKVQRVIGTSSSWEITSDDEYESTSTIGKRTGMLNPLHASASSSNPQAHGEIKTRGNSLKGVHSQLPSLTPATIPDSSYQAYLLGRRPKKKSASFFDKICCAKFCAFYSWIALMFFVFIGILLDTQPIYIKGVLPKSEQYEDGSTKKQVIYDFSQSERLTSASHAYRAAFIYFLICCLCLAYAYNFQWWLKSRMGQYHDVPDADSSVFNVFRREGELPSFNPAMRAYQYENGISSRIWKATGLAMHRIGMYMASKRPNYKGKRRKRRKNRGAKDV